MTDERWSKKEAERLADMTYYSVEPHMDLRKLARSYLAVLDELDAARAQALADRAYQTENKRLADENAKLREQIDRMLDMTPEKRAKAAKDSGLSIDDVFPEPEVKK